MARKIRTRVIEEYETDEPEDSPSPRSPPRRSRFLRRLAVGGLLLLVLAWFAPWILATSGLWKSLIPIAAPELAGKIDAQSLSLSWLSPIVVQKAALRDAKGELLALVETVRTERSLLELALYPSQIGKVLLHAPHVQVSLREDGSNLEDFLAVMAKRSETSPSQISLSLQVADGALDVADEISGRRWGLEHIGGNLHWPAAADQAKTGDISAVLFVGEPQEKAALQRGEIATKLSWVPGATAHDPLGSGTIDVVAKEIPSEAVEGVVRRFALDLRPRGPVTAEGRYEWSDSFATQKITIKKAASSGLALSSSALAEDEVRAHIEHLSGVLALENGRVTASDLRLDSDVAQLRGSGSLALSSYSLAGLLAALQSASPDDSGTFQGDIDAALVAEQLRRSLRLRDDTRIVQGVVKLSVGTKLVDRTRVWEAALGMDKLIAEASGGRVTWNEPVQFACAIQETPQGFSIREFTAQSSFARVHGSGTLADGELTADVDLDQLRRELSRFAELGSGELAGQLSGKLKWQQGERDAWSARADARVQDFQMALPGMVPWREQDLQVAAEASGILRGSALVQLDAARFTVGSGGDKLDVQLAEPLATPSLASVWPASYSLVGRMETWLPRLQTWLPLSGWNVAGQIDLQGTGRFAPSRVALEGVKLRLESLSVRRFDFRSQPPTLQLAIDESLVKIDTTATWDRERSTLVSPATTLASSSLALRADDLKLELGEHISITGLVDFRGDLARISAWFGDSATRTWLFGGMVLGRIEAAVASGVVQGTVSAECENLSYLTRTLPQPTGGTVAAASSTPSWQMAWVEPKVNISGEGTYDTAGDQLTLKQARLDAAAISLAASGTVGELSRTCQVNLAGKLACDMASVAQKLRPILGDTLELTGNQRRDFELRGPLFAAAATPRVNRQVANLSTLTGQGGIGWDQARFLGLTAGAASIDARLDRGIVALEPLDVAVSEGRLLAAPRIELADANLPLRLDKGPVLQRVRISPELCRGWLKYVAPLLADATRAEGKFSLDLESGTVPLMQPEAMDVGGILSIHEAQVGPGPLALTYLNLALQVKSILAGKPANSESIDPKKGWILLPEQQVAMRAFQGRVYHQGLLMNVNDVVVRTEGSVGFDQTLNLVAAIPVQDKWIEKDKLPTAFKGKSIYIPIRGRISRPEPDTKVLKDLAAQMLVGGAKSYFQSELNKNRDRIGEELQKGLDRLFNPQSQQPPQP
ncbi:MAG TPA: hypothetical protein VFB96_05235 [Pirellulaceae bacterium]|nr:hypothetical protein [Pirellulaceae bacterium]